MQFEHFWHGLLPNMACHVTHAKNVSFPYLKSYCALKKKSANFVVLLHP